MEKDFLKIIVDHKKEELEFLKKKRPENLLRLNSQIKREIRPFYETLKKPNNMKSGKINIIAEIKRASPSKGDIRLNLDPGKMAKDYEKGGASAISILTDEKFFKGSADDFTIARKATRLPMLRKDFIISAYQVYDSFILGADAILLIAKILSREQLKDLLALTHELKMSALVEINSEKDFEKASNSGARLIGINNRNLNSFDTDISTATRLISLFNKDQVAVAASGISGKKDINKNCKAGIFNFLIGESLVKADNTVNFLKSLIE
ncbi:MAG: indole-3-glycerol phosphate synthase TrpC [Desulfobacula sp.]|uniref:indole-3-glycerol phosphate synthase TrpC n=1 Tax=Desulfobacula sp. TaxID=2593537 RepID=UPI0025C30751|nr:indole-3-glycerol phosphate synthase TrpC [Desulfobacula sp.]MCD4718294.1 indole-3-glycerol phosphate synthase TrpC [Desulfobacula sp.]